MARSVCCRARFPPVTLTPWANTVQGVEGDRSWVGAGPLCWAGAPASSPTRDDRNEKALWAGGDVVGPELPPADPAAEALERPAALAGAAGPTLCSSSETS